MSATEKHSKSANGNSLRNENGKDSNSQSAKVIAWQDDPVEDQDRAAGRPVKHPYSQSPLLAELGLLAHADDQRCRTLLLRSQFDKAGLAFLLSQREDPQAPGTLLPTGMLGRIGLAGNAAGRSAYSRAASRVKISEVWVGQQDGQSPDASGTSTDFWHVDLFGWNLPTIPFRSRFLFDRNLPSGQVDESDFTQRFLATARSGLEVSDITEAPAWNQLALPQGLVDRAWVHPRTLIQTGAVAP